MSGKVEKEQYDKAWFAAALWMGKAENHILSGAGKYPLPNRFNNKYSLHEYSTNDVIDTKEIILQIKELIQLK